jgi:pimeloyl-ACP methyl ester carboxylesterase
VTSGPGATVRFPSGVEGETCEATLHLPDRSAGPLPIVVLGHGLGAVRTMGLDAYVHRFVEAGYACVTFDHRHLGGSDGQPRQLIDIARQREDWRSALAWVRADPRFDPDRVVAWGTSFGGGHVLAVAADDHRLAAAIVQCPFTDGRAPQGSGSWSTTAKVALLAVRDRISERRGRPPVHVATVGPARSAALMTAPDAEPGYLGLVDPADPGGFENRVAARFVLQVREDRPGLRAAEIACPILFAICEHDSVAPAAAAERAAALAPQAEAHVYPCGHFDIYVGADLERAVADMVAFLRAHVPPGA